MHAVIRPSAETDMAAVTAIYAHHVLTNPATFELEPPSLAEMIQRRQALLDKGLPWLVAESGGEIVGYAYAGPHRTRPAYHWTLEDSIYIRHDHLGRGLGRALLQPLITRTAELGYRQMVAVIGGGNDNPGSVALHRACGFHAIGIMEAVGWKFGRWIDCALMQRPLGAGGREPVNP